MVGTLCYVMIDLVPNSQNWLTFSFEAQLRVRGARNGDKSFGPIGVGKLGSSAKEPEIESADTMNHRKRLSKV